MSVYALSKLDSYCSRYYSKSFEQWRMRTGQLLLPTDPSTPMKKLSATSDRKLDNLIFAFSFSA
jgi:hypothetical protein